MEIREQDIVLKHNISWGEKAYTLSEIVEKYRLPRIVKCSTETSCSRMDQFNFNFKQPLMIYKKRRVKKIMARSLHIHPVKRTLHHVGNPLLIPEDYKGWFACVPSTEESTSSSAVPVYNSVEELANSCTKEFLIGGSTPIIALQTVHQGENGFYQRQCWPGDVLKKYKIYTAETKKKGFFKKSKIIQEKFLQCCDELDRMLLIPFEVNGTFYQVDTNSYGTGNGLQRIDSIIQFKKLPCVVKLVFGKPPTIPCAFTGDIQLDFVIEETFLIGSTVFNLRNIMFEFNINNPLEFYVADEQNDLKASQSYKNAWTLCSEQASLFVQNIKVTYDFNDEFDQNLHLNEVDNSSTNPKLSRHTVPAHSQRPAHHMISENDTSIMHSKPPKSFPPPPLPDKCGLGCMNTPVLISNAHSNACSDKTAKKGSYMDMSGIHFSCLQYPVPSNSNIISSDSNTHTSPSPHHKSVNREHYDKAEDVFIPDWSPSGNTSRNLPSPHKKTNNKRPDDNCDDAFMELHQQCNACLPIKMLERTFLKDGTQTEIQLNEVPVYENLKKIREIIGCHEQYVTNIENNTHSRGSLDSTTSLQNLSQRGSFDSDTSSLSSRNDSTRSSQSSMPELPPRNQFVDSLCPPDPNVRDSGIQDSYDELQSMNAAELMNRLNEIGVKNTTMQYLTDKQIDGYSMSCMFDTDHTLQKHLPANVVSIVDRTKIILFIQNINWDKQI